MLRTGRRVDTTGLPTATPVAALTGLTLTTAGTVVFVALEALVEKLDVNVTIVLPAWSVTPLTVTV